MLVMTAKGIYHDLDMNSFTIKFQITLSHPHSHPNVPTVGLPHQLTSHTLHNISIPINLNATNLLPVHNVSCTDYKRETIGPRLRSALAKHQLDFKDSWKEAQTALSRH